MFYRETAVGDAHWAPPPKHRREQSKCLAMISRNTTTRQICAACFDGKRPFVLASEQPVHNQPVPLVHAGSSYPGCWFTRVSGQHPPSMTLPVLPPVVRPSVGKRDRG